jgi:hypothetical protein
MTQRMTVDIETNRKDFPEKLNVRSIRQCSGPVSGLSTQQESHTTKRTNQHPAFSAYPKAAYC